MGLFDFNGDGKTSWFEMALAAKIFEETTRDDEPDPILYSDSGDDWREYCEDGSEFDVDPEDYETEEEYCEALEEARYGWRELCDTGEDVDIDPEDYETEGEYCEALEEVRYG